MPSSPVCVPSFQHRVSNRYPWYGGHPTDDTEDKTQVLSIDLSDPENVRVVDGRVQDRWSMELDG